MSSEETFYRVIRCQGVTRRSFLKYCSLTTTSLGLGAGMTPKTAQTLGNKPRIPVVWIHGLECTCCTESSIRPVRPLTRDAILSLISLDHDDILMIVARNQAEEVFEDIITQYSGEYILIVEDNPPLSGQGMFYISGGRPFIEKPKRAAAGTNAIIVQRVCASQDCVQAAWPNPTWATPIGKVITGKPIIKVLDCPPIPDVMSTTITYVVAFDRLPDVDGMSHPLMSCDQRTHDKCCRRAHLDAGGFAQSWDDDAVREGCCLHEVDCKGPITYNARSPTHWNDGVSFPIQSGHGYLGCAEDGFWDRGSSYSRVTDTPQMGTHSTADAVGSTALGMVTAVVGAYAVTSAIDQHRRHNQQPTETEHQPGNKDKQT